MPLTNHLVIMARRPAIGRVKTRLAGQIGAVAAWSFYRTQLAQTVRRLSPDPRWHTVLAVTPERALAENIWPSGVDRIAQRGIGLGDRMNHLFESLPPGPVVIVGSDIPDIQSRHIAAAFRALGNADFVFGPARDGGYWLVGQRRRPRIIPVFENVRWSSPHALADTLRGLKGSRYALIDTLSDVDTADDLARIRVRTRGR